MHCRAARSGAPILSGVASDETARRELEGDFRRFQDRLTDVARTAALGEGLCVCFVEGGGGEIVQPTSFEKKALTEARFTRSGAIICIEFYPFSISVAGN